MYNQTRGAMILVNEYPLMDLKTDYAFKQLFGQPRTADILVAFLNALLKRDGDERIVSVEFVNTEISPAHKDGKAMRLDVHVRTGRDERINIEIQVGSQEEMGKRTLMYWAGIFNPQAHSGMKYEDLKQAITINIVNFRCFHSTERYHTAYHVTEDIDRFRLSDVLEIHFVEMPKFRQARKNRLEEAAHNPLERWLLLLDASKNTRIRKELEVIAMADTTMEHALDVWDEISQDEAKQQAYHLRRIAIMDEISKMHSAEKKGLEKGLRKGRQEGKLEAAKAMLEDGLDMVRVSRLTGIPVEELERLQEEHH